MLVRVLRTQLTQICTSGTTNDLTCLLSLDPVKNSIIEYFKDHPAIQSDIKEYDEFAQSHDKSNFRRLLNIKTQESVFYSTPDDKVEAKQEELKAKQEKFEAHKENRAKALVSFTKKTKGGKVRKKYR